MLAPAFDNLASATNFSMIALRVAPGELRICVKIPVAISIFVGGAVELSDDGSIPICLASHEGELFNSSFGLARTCVVLLEGVSIGLCDPVFSVVMMDSDA